MKIKFISILAAFIIIVLACSKKTETTNTVTTIDCTGITPKFSTDVSILIQTSCATGSGCHGIGSTNAGGPLMNYTQIANKKIGIRNQVLNNLMPKGGSLTLAQKQTIVCWIDAGTLNN